MDYQNDNTRYGVKSQPPNGVIFYNYYEVIKMETRLRDLREDKDLTQRECAKIAYISKNSYIRYENGERILDTIIQFAKYYDVSIDYIAKLTDTKKPYPRNK